MQLSRRERAVDVVLLGALEVRAAGRMVPLGQRQQRHVFTVLAVEVDRLVPADALIDRVWGDDPPAGARRTLQIHVARLRRALTPVRGDAGPPLQGRSGGYILRLDPDRVDVHRFRRLVGDAGAAGCPPARQMELLREALDLWRGEPLAGLTGEWAQRVRDGWRQQQIDATVAWALAAIAAGNPAVVLGPLHDLVGEHPLVEVLAATLIRALHAAGQTTEALACYTATRQRLAEELGTEPGVHLREAHRRVLAGAEAAGDLVNQAQTDYSLAVLSSERAEPERTVHHGTRALDRYRRLGNSRGEANALNAVGLALVQLGEERRGAEHLEAALALARRADYPSGEAATLDSLGHLMASTGRHGDAARYYREAGDVLRRLGNTFHLAEVTERLGDAHAALGDARHARSAWQEALELYRNQHRETDAARVREQLDRSVVAGDTERL